MALDPGLYTLDLVRRGADESVCDWVETQRTPKALYTRARATRSIEYSSVLYRTLFGPSRPLVTAAAPTALTKSKTLRLRGPDEDVQLSKQGMTLVSEWRFQWPQTTAGPDGEPVLFQWRRDKVLGPASAGKNAYTCYAIRSPDPSIPLAIYRPLTGKDRHQLRYSTQVWNTQKEGAGRVEGHLQFVDYNIVRLGLPDLRGLEYLLLMSLSTLLDADYDDKYKTPVDNVYLSFTPAGTSVRARGKKRATSSQQPSAPNEVAIEEWGQPLDYVEHCMRLLRDDGPAPTEGGALDHGLNMTFIALRAEGARHVPKAIQIAAEVKRAFYKLPKRKKGTDQEELFQYITDNARSPSPSSSRSPSPVKRDDDAPGGRPIIKLNDPPEPESPRKALGRLWPMGDKKEKDANKSEYQAPPESVTIFLSKERMPELEASASPGPRRRPVSQASIAPPPEKPRIGSGAHATLSSPRPGGGGSSSSSQPSAPPRPPKIHTNVAVAPAGSAWNGNTVASGFVASGHPVPAGFAELDGVDYAKRPPPPLPKPATPDPPVPCSPAKAPAVPPASTPSPAHGHKEGRMGRFFERVKHVRDLPPPGSR